MSSPSELTKNQQRARRLLEALLKYNVNDSELKPKVKGLKVSKIKDGTDLLVVGTIQALANLTEAYGTSAEEKLDTEKIKDAIAALEKLLPNFKRETRQGSSRWTLTIPLWHVEINENLRLFDDECRERNAKITGNTAQNTQIPTIKETETPHNIPLGTQIEFVGREAELEALHDSLQTSRQVALVAVKGMGGVGKTELAIQYAKQQLHKYAAGVCWLSAQGISVGIQILRFVELKFKLVLPEDWELADKLKYCWQNWQSGEALLVFDDVTDYAQQVKPYLPPDLSRFKVLLTTRFSFDSTLKQLPLNVLKPLAAMKLLKSLVGRERLNQEAWIARKICKFLGYLPLALELVGRYLDKQPDLSSEKLLKRLERKRLEHEAVAKVNPLMRYEYGVAEAFELSWEQLDENTQKLGCYLSLYALADIPLFVEDIEDDEEQESLEKALAGLLDWHLLQRQGKGIYRLHPLIRQFFQMKLEKLSQADELKIAFAAQMVEVAKQIPQQPTQDLIKQLTPLIPHTAETANHLASYIKDESLISIFTGLGWFYQSQGFYQQAEPWLQQCVKICQNRLGSKHPHVATSLNNLAELYRLQGRYIEAEPLFLQALELRRCLLGEQHLDVATSLNNLALLYYSQGRYIEAEPLYKQALELYKHLLGEQNPYIAASLNNLAELYSLQGRYIEAEPLFLQALELKKRLWGEQHLEIATNLNNLAGLYKLQGRYDEAEPLCKQALKLIKHLLGEQHPLVATSLNNLAGLYSLQGRYGEAESLHLQALELRKCLLGEQHPDVATSLNNLAALYSLQGRYDEAEPLCKQALKLIKRLLGEQHPDVATSLNNLAGLYSLQGRYNEAEPLCKQALELRKCLLGEQHPLVATSLKNLAALHKLQGRYSEAEPLYQQALAMCERTLGVGHPHTMTVRGNYAKFLRQAYR